MYKRQINDCIAEVWGFRKARLIIWSGFAMNFFVVMLGLIAVALPAAPDVYKRQVHRCKYSGFYPFHELFRTAHVIFSDAAVHRKHRLL